jgi:hypothetical protein
MAKKSSTRLRRQKSPKKLDKSKTMQLALDKAKMQMEFSEKAKPILFYLKKGGPESFRLAAAQTAKTIRLDDPVEHTKLVNGLMASLRMDPSYKVKAFVARALQIHGRREDVGALRMFSERTEEEMLKIKDPKDKEKWALRGEILDALMTANRAIELIELREKLKKRARRK